MLVCCRQNNEVYSYPPTHHSEKYLIFCAIGAIIMVGAVFIFLSAQQILPASQNAISNLGIWGIMMAGGVFLLGNSILTISATAHYFTKHDRSHNQQIIEENAPLAKPIPMQQRRGVIHVGDGNIKKLISQSFCDQLPEAHYYIAISLTDRTPTKKAFSSFFSKVAASDNPNLPIVDLQVRWGMNEKFSSAIKEESYEIDGKIRKVLHMNIIGKDSVDFDAKDAENGPRFQILREALETCS